MDALVTEDERLALKVYKQESILRSLVASRTLVAKLKAAGITDYSKLGVSSRVDCHFCQGVWTSGQEPKHRERCALALTEEDMK